MAATAVKCTAYTCILLVKELLLEDILKKKEISISFCVYGAMTTKTKSFNQCNELNGVNEGPPHSSELDQQGLGLEVSIELGQPAAGR